jgi:hypothetical protein
MNGSGPTGDAKLSGLASGGLVAIGGTPVPGLVVAGALGGTSLSGTDFTAYQPGPTHGWDARSGVIAALVDWFPDEHGGWHIGGALGLNAVSVTNSSAQITWSGVGFGGRLFGGYDRWIGPEWSLGIGGALFAGSSASMKDNSRNDTGYEFGSIGASLEATLLYH